MTALDFNYHYPYASVCQSTTDQKSFLFSHCSENEEDNNVPCFFYGRINNAYLVSKCLSALAKTVGSHFALRPGQLASMRDPIVSVGNRKLHFEAFSSCNSVYASVDVMPQGIDGEFIQSGCTNIDFNDNTIRALNAVSQSEKLLIGVGSNEMQLVTEKNKTTEKKVALPNRWIKGLGNVQVYLSEMELAFTLNKIEAIQLFKTLPKTSIKGDYFLTKSGRFYRFLPSAKPGAIKIGGIHRLNLMQHLLMLIDALHVYKNEKENSIAFVLDFGDIRMLFLFSGGVYRGFSGEGSNLENMLEQVPREWIQGLNNFFKTNEVFNPTLVSIEHDIAFSTMDALKSSLSSIGLLGYDLVNYNYFYRRLPFKPERLIRFNPRLQNAKQLVEKDEVVLIENSANYIKAHVKGSADVVHTVIKQNDGYQCTCTWYTNNKNRRGLCKHILAVMLST